MGGPAHPSPSTADLAALHAKANWLTVPVAGPSIAVVAPRYHHGLSRARILEAQQKQHAQRLRAAPSSVPQLSNELASTYLHCKMRPMVGSFLRWSNGCQTEAESSAAQQRLHPEAAR